MHICSRENQNLQVNVGEEPKEHTSQNLPGLPRQILESWASLHLPAIPKLGRERWEDQERKMILGYLTVWGQPELLETLHQTNKKPKRLWIKITIHMPSCFYFNFGHFTEVNCFRNISTNRKEKPLWKRLTCLKICFQECSLLPHLKRFCPSANCFHRSM